MEGKKTMKEKNTNKEIRLDLINVYLKKRNIEIFALKIKKIFKSIFSFIK